MIQETVCLGVPVIISLVSLIRQILTDFQNSFAAGKSLKFPTKQYVTSPTPPKIMLPHYPELNVQFRCIICILNCVPIKRQLPNSWW